MSGGPPFAPYSPLTDKYRYLTRTAIQVVGSAITPVPLSSIVGLTFQIGAIPIEQTMVLRLVKNLTFANCVDVSNTIFLSCLALNIEITDSNANILAFI